MKIIYKFSNVHLIVLCLIITCFTSFSHGILQNDVIIDSNLKNSADKQPKQNQDNLATIQEIQNKIVENYAQEIQQAKSVRIDRSEGNNNINEDDDEEGGSKINPNSDNKEEEVASPVLKIVKLVADLKETVKTKATEKIEKLLNSKIDKSKTDESNNESPIVIIPEYIEPKDSNKHLKDTTNIEPIEELADSATEISILSTDATPTEPITTTLETLLEPNESIIIKSTDPTESKTDSIKQEENTDFLNLSESNLSSVGVVVGKPDMESFEEWKEMKLKEIPDTSSSSTSSTTNESDTISDSKESLASSTQSKTEQNQQQQQQQNKKSLRKEKKQELVPRYKNYAGLDCGAKIIDNNPESSNPAHILTENKDDYMLNSCKNNVWFIIELCEPIKLIEISLANFELFSNVPRQFRMYASERYIQASNWNNKHLLGTFEAQNTRTIQTFSVNEPLNSFVSKDAAIETTTESPVPIANGELANENVLSNNIIQASSSYVKYVKFEMLSHYGTEHFCPLSLVRIYGKTKNDDEIHDSIEESAEDLVNENNLEVKNEIANHLKKEETVLDDNEKLNSIKQTTNNSLFETASLFLRNVISIILEKSLNPYEFFINNDLFKNQENLFVDDEFKLDFIEKPSKSTMRNNENSSNNNESFKSLQKSPETKRLHKKRKDLIQMLFHKILCNSSDKCCMSMPYPKLGSFNAKKIYQNENIFASNQDSTCYNWLSKYCGYFFLINANSISLENTSILNNLMKHVKNATLNKPIITIENLDEEIDAFTFVDLNNNAYYISNEWLDNQIATINFEKFSEFKQKLVRNMFEKKPNVKNIVRKNEKRESKSVHINEEKNLQENNKLDISVDNQKKIETSSISPSITSTTTKITHLNIQTTPVTTKDDVNIDINDNLKETKPEKNDKVSSSEPITTTPFFIESIQTELNNLLSETLELSLQTVAGTTVSTTTTSTTTSTSTQSTSPQPQSASPVTPVQTSTITLVPVNGKIHLNAKDDNLTILNNRIKILELNMSLSSQYLEKLSQHYRKQLDEMQKAFNLTLTALIDTIRVADERDIKQNDRIILIEKRLDKMKYNLDSVSGFLNELKFQTDVIMWTIIILINLVIMIEFLNCFSVFSSKKVNKDKSNQEPLTYNLTINQINSLIDNKLKHLVDQQNELFKLLEQDKEILEKKIENLTQSEKQHDTSLSFSSSSNSIYSRQKSLITPNASNSQAHNNASNNSHTGLILPCSLYNDYESDMQKNAAAATMITSTLVAAVSLAAASASCNTMNQHTSEKNMENLL